MENFEEFDQQVRQPRKEVGDIISHAIDNYKKTFAYGVVMIIIYYALNWLGSILLAMVTGFNSQAYILALQDTDVDRSLAAFEVLNTPGITAYMLLAFIFSLLLLPFHVGFIYITHKANTNQPILFSDIFMGYKRKMMEIIIYSFVFSIIVAIGTVLCILPGIAIFVLFYLGLPIILFEKQSAIGSLKKSFNVSMSSFWLILGVVIVSVLIAISGLLLCCIGVILTVMFVYSALYSLYCAICGTPNIKF